MDGNGFQVRGKHISGDSRVKRGLSCVQHHGFRRMERLGRVGEEKDLPAEAAPQAGEG